MVSRRPFFTSDEPLGGRHVRRLNDTILANAFSRDPIETQTEGFGRVGSAAVGSIIPTLQILADQKKQAGIGKTLAEAIAAGSPSQQAIPGIGNVATPGGVPGRIDPNALGSRTVPGDMGKMLAILAANPNTAPMALQQQMSQLFRQSERAGQAPPTRTIRSGREILTQEWNAPAREYRTIARAPAPQKGAAGGRGVLMKFPDPKNPGGFITRRVSEGELRKGVSGGQRVGERPPLETEGRRGAEIAKSQENFIDGKGPPPSHGALRRQLGAPNKLDGARPEAAEVDKRVQEYYRAQKARIPGAALRVTGKGRDDQPTYGGFLPEGTKRQVKTPMQQGEKVVEKVDTYIVRNGRWHRVTGQ